MDLASPSLRQAVRSLRRRPGLTVAIALTLGPAMGGVIALLDLINLLAWSPPPVARPSEVVEVFTANPHGPQGAWGPTSYLDYRDYAAAASSHVGLAAATRHGLELTTPAGTVSVSAAAVSGNYFEVLGVPAALGRALEPPDDEAGAAPAVVLGFATWQRHFAGDAACLGRPVRLDGLPFTVVGVAREGFAGTRARGRWELFVPVAQLPRLSAGRLDWLADRGLRRFDLLARLRRGASAAGLEAQLAARAAQLDAAEPQPGLERRIRVLPASRVRPAERLAVMPTVRVLMAAVVLLLLISCANVAQLLMARAIARSAPSRSRSLPAW